MVTLSDYMTHFQTKFTSTLFLGESLSMILPSFLAIAQGNGQLTCISLFDNNKTSNFSTIAIYKTARFSVSIYFLCSITFSFDVFLCFKSPCPPFANTIKGSVLVLLIWLSTYILISYPRLVMANYLRIHSPNGMFWFGVSNQIGSFIGSVAAYLLVETFSQFKEILPCEQLKC
ncbi:unnamed protein product [Rotaria sordida]|uniref:Riboflavin transporter n=1 Tax=Rotaria sordida TaxID=392033 RepID=A0A815LLG4_9BILA|nr:unnamed protein product [Rotaria sordida]CAF1376331.1 unnamed protein product [Rotaria sordida]CAF1410049.1 unnamed protein product [Rotaria sordida]